jgi:hypothetical protein
LRAAGIHTAHRLRGGAVLVPGSHAIPPPRVLSRSLEVNRAGGLAGKSFPYPQHGRETGKHPATPDRALTDDGLRRPAAPHHRRTRPVLARNARRANCSPGYPSNVIHGRKPLTPRVAAGLDQALGTGDTFTAHALNPPPGGNGGPPGNTSPRHADGALGDLDGHQAGDDTAGTLTELAARSTAAEALKAGIRTGYLERGGAVPVPRAALPVPGSPAGSPWALPCASSSQTAARCC